MNQGNIRNFAIIAHIDHGKSTLADRMLELTHTIQKDKLQEQFLDQNPISRERGITIKLAPVRMNYTLPASPRQSSLGGNAINYTLDLIDTPGHVDFSYEVSRTLAACEGAILLVDATQSIQAQTVAHFHEAQKENLVLIPVINKIDLPNAQIEKTAQDLQDIFGFNKEDIIYISAKTGENVEQLLQAIVTRFPPPSGNQDAPLKALIFDAVYDEYRGVVAYVRIVDGSVSKGNTICMYQNKVTAETTDVGYFTPFLKSSSQLSTGEIGYITTGIKDIRKCRVGDTITQANSKNQMSNITPLEGYTIPIPMVFFGVYPKNTNDIVLLRESLNKLSLNDTALSFSEEYSAYLGSGYRIGFLGLLHAEIVKERLQQEFGLDLLFTMPQVLYQTDENGGRKEPYIKMDIYAPNEYIGPIMSICQKKKGIYLNLIYHKRYAVLTYEMPYSMFIRGLSSELKSVSSGYASIDYEPIGYRPADVVELQIRINDMPIDVLSELVYRDEAGYIARQKAEKLKESLTRQQFRQIIQAVVGSAIVAREEIPPFRKDVLQKMSGGDRTRKDKLLEKQKKGKSRMIAHAKIDLPQEAIMNLMSTE